MNSKVHNYSGGAGYIFLVAFQFNLFRICFRRAYFSKHYLSNSFGIFFWFRVFLAKAIKSLLISIPRLNTRCHIYRLNFAQVRHLIPTSHLSGHSRLKLQPSTAVLQISHWYISDQQSTVRYPCNQFPGPSAPNPVTNVESPTPRFQYSASALHFFRLVLHVALKSYMYWHFSWQQQQTPKLR